jgi:hypothetical protein
MQGILQRRATLTMQAPTQQQATYHSRNFPKPLNPSCITPNQTPEMEEEREPTLYHPCPRIRLTWGRGNRGDGKW